jgi:hypothetical protein
LETNLADAAKETQAAVTAAASITLTLVVVVCSLAGS